MRDQQTIATPSKTACSSEFHNSITETNTKGQAMTAIEFPYTRKHAGEALHKLHGFIGSAQLSVIGELCYSEERRYFYSKLVELANIVETMPVTYQTDGQGGQAIVHLHYFMQSCDWYIIERDCEAEQLQAFGIADLGYGSELGYISIIELLNCGAELDMHWQPRKLCEI